MLDAFIKKNVRRILTTKDHENEKNEDAITSMVFTPLRFMSAQDALACFSDGLLDLQKILLGREPKSHTIDLWPQGMKARINSGEIDTRCEPDVVAEFQFHSGRPLLLVGEMKWAPVARALLQAEVSRQAEATRKGSKSKIARDVFHFTIVKHPPTFTKVQIGSDSLQTWKAVHSSLRNLDNVSAKSSAVAQWADLVSQFLEAAEQLIFEGFDFETAGLPMVESPFVFFRRGK